MKAPSLGWATLLVAPMFFSANLLANNPEKTRQVSLPTISVISTKNEKPSESELDLVLEPPQVPYSDTADYLRSISGVTAGRIGGHGLDIVIRGQSQNQLNLSNQNTTTLGACPNRMDPPSAYSNLKSFDTVTVIRGYQSVLNGPGGPGGAIQFERKQPDLGPGFDVSGALWGGYDSNGQSKYSDAHILAGTEQGYVRARGSIKDADNYHDGHGEEVRSAFTEKTAGLTLGATPEDSHLRLNYDATRIEDALFPGAGMDSPLSLNRRWSLQYERDFMHPVIKRMDFTAYSSRVEHEMDNFSLRVRSKAPFRRVDSDSNTYGLVLNQDWQLGDQLISSRLDIRQNHRDATRFQGVTASSVGMTQSHLWPDIQLTEVGLGAETDWALNQKTAMVTGLRYDFVDVDYGKANRLASATGRSANDLYQLFYGKTARSVQEHHLGGLIRLEHLYSNDITLYGGLSRSARTAGATERGLANDMIMMGMNKSWVGNPDIRAEKHHQFEIGVDYHPAKLQLATSVYVDYVHDYILKDSARGQKGVLLDASGATVYRNIDALLAGFELTSEWKALDNLTFSADAAFTWGQSLDTNEPLAQIPPLQGSLALDWAANESLDIHAFLQWASQQKRVDTNRANGSGRDVTDTSGYAVLDLLATLHYFDPFELSFGVTNVFDKEYANHLNRENVFDSESVQVNEPGRSVFVQTRLEF